SRQLIREPQSHCATRKSSCRTFTAGSPRRAAPGRRIGRRRATRRRRDERATRRPVGPGWATALSWPTDAPLSKGERARLAARQGLRGRTVRAHAIRPGGRTRIACGRLLRLAAHTAAGGSVRIGGFDAAVCRLRAESPWGTATLARDHTRYRTATTRRHRGALRTSRRRRGDRGARAPRPLGVAGTRRTARDRAPCVRRHAATRARVRRRVLRAGRAGDGTRSRARAEGGLPERRCPLSAPG